jgi:hypothetical protein
MSATVEENSYNKQDMQQQQQQQESTIPHYDRFKNLLDDDEDDDDYIVVSSTQQRLDLLLAEDEDDIIVVRSVPSNVHITPGESVDTISFNYYLTSVAVIFIVGSIFLLSLRNCFRSKRKSHRDNGTAEESLSKRKVKEEDDKDINPRMPKKCKQVLPAQQKAGDKDGFEPPDTDSSESSQKSPPPSPPGNGTSTKSEAPGLVEDSSLLVMESARKEQHLSFSPPKSLDSSNNQNIVMKLSSLESTTTTTTTRQLNVSNDININANSTTTTASSQEHKLLVALEIAQDIKLVEDVLKNEGIVNNQALAAQVAVGWHSLERIIHSQRETEIRRMLLDTHQRNLDRQLSERQHEETLHAATYDPNWNEKLKSKRDKCWDLVSRLVWEGGVAYQCARLVRPILRLCMTSDGFSVNDLAGLVVSNVSLNKKKIVIPLCCPVVSSHYFSNSSAAAIVSMLPWIALLQAVFFTHYSPYHRLQLCSATLDWIPC